MRSHEDTTPRFTRRVPATDAPLKVALSRHAVGFAEPLDAYRALRDRFGDASVYLLESLAGGAGDRRTATVGFNPLLSLTLGGTEAGVEGHDVLVRLALSAAARLPGVVVSGNRVGLPEDGTLWDLLRAIRHLFAITAGERGPGFAFGYVGFLGYDAVRFVERLPLRIPRRDDMPDSRLAVYQGALHLDLSARTAELRVADAACWPTVVPSEIAALVGTPPRPPAPREAPAPRAVRHAISKERFCADVETALHHIAIGDIYQVQLGQELTITTEASPEDVYLRLRARNPAPYMVLARFGAVTLVGASPEVFVRLEDGAITMRPLAGTVRRGATDAETAAAAARLRSDPKEVAEHVMLVDLCRNDIGRICVPGSLDVTELLATELYSHVVHLVSTVVGRLEPGSDVYDTIAACFPAGTMTGAPKVRAMEIIEALEGTRRGIYAGAVGVIDFEGDADLALCIRTAVHAGGAYVIRASAGIVADSVPDTEWNETVAKLGATYWAVTGQELTP